MNELNNEVIETIEVEITEPVEVLESNGFVEEKETNNLAIGAVVVTGLIAGGIVIKKLWDRRKSKIKTESVEAEVVEETVVEETVINETK